MLPAQPGVGVMAYPSKGVLWLPEEVECLLWTLHDLEVGPRVMPSTHLETQPVFTEVAERLGAHGYRRMPSQCRAKFKRKKAALFEALCRGRCSPLLCLVACQTQR